MISLWSQKLGIMIIVLLVGIGIGGIVVYKYKPHLMTQTQTIVKNVMQDHIITVTKTIVQPNGTKEIDTTITDNSIHTDNSNITIIKAPNWHVGLGASTEIDLSPVYSLQIEKRIAGPLFIGARAETKGTIGITIGIEF